MLVLFGSETGNAEDVANMIARQCMARGMDACALPMDTVADPKQLAQEKLVVFVCSTTGAQAPTHDGEFQYFSRVLYAIGPLVPRKSRFAATHLLRPSS